MKRFRNINIYETLTEIVSPEHTALVVWDSQNALVNHTFNRDEYLSNLKDLLAAARKAKVTVVFTKITPIPVGFQSSWNISQSLKRFKLDDPAKIPLNIIPGTPEAEINFLVAPVEGDLVINKQSPNIFFGTNFEQLMRFRGIDTILFSGIATEFGIEHSARDSSARGFYTIVLSDCVSSPDKNSHDMALKIMQKLVLVQTSKEVMNAWM
jgi:nicotinamidase-related amidase